MTQSYMNVDDIEIAKFNQLAHLWWDMNGPMSMLHEINILRMQYITKWISLDKLTILDVGCGGGILSESLAKAGARVTGIDLSDIILKVANQHAQNNKLSIQYRKCDIDIMATQHSDKYDIVCCMEMLEHVPYPNKIVEACAKLLKPNGSIFFSTINRTIKAWLYAIVIGENILKLLPKGTHQYKKLIKPHELERWANSSNLFLHDTNSFIYNLFLKKFSLKQKVDINYITHYKKQS